MVQGAGYGGLMALLPLVGLVSILLTRRKRNGATPVDSAVEERRAATLETDRRMAAYLARNQETYDPVPPRDAQETQR